MITKEGRGPEVCGNVQRHTVQVEAFILFVCLPLLDGHHPVDVVGCGCGGGGGDGGHRCENVTRLIFKVLSFPPPECLCRWGCNRWRTSTFRGTTLLLPSSIRGTGAASAGRLDISKAN